MNVENSPSIENIMKVGFGFMPAKILLTAVELDIFTIIAKTKSAKAAQIKKQLNLLCNDRQVYDFLDALVGLGFLEREGVLETALYSNSRDTDHFLDKNKPTYLGGGLELGNSRMYKMWGSLDEALRTGARQNDAENDEDMFDQNYKSPEKLRKFVNGMGDLQAVGFRALASKFDFSKYQKMIDIGGSGAKFSLTVAQKHSHLSCCSLDLPPVEAIARANIIKNGLQSQISTGIIDFFKDDFPKADVITMGNILHDWGQNEKDHLLKSSFKALNEGGAFIAIENVIDDDRRKNVYGLQMSLNMLLETNGGFDYTFKQFTEWALKAGFKQTELIHLVGPKSAAVAYK